MNLFNLSGKTALIVGASSGLGRRAAQTLSAAGARTILASRRLDKLEELADTLPNALAIKIDVLKKPEITNAFKKFSQLGEKIDIVLCSAGIGSLTPIFETDQASSDSFDRIIQTNVMGTWYIVQAAANYMKETKSAGSIITIASVNGANRVREKIVAYCTSKAAIIQMTKSLTKELAEANIRINCISPGLFHTPMTDYKLHTPTMKQTMAKTIPLGFVADPEALDGTILYLASNQASPYVTGTCITVDGGVSWGGEGGK